MVYQLCNTIFELNRKLSIEDFHSESRSLSRHPLMELRSVISAIKDTDSVLQKLGHSNAEITIDGDLAVLA